MKVKKMKVKKMKEKKKVKIIQMRIRLRKQYVEDNDGRICSMTLAVDLQMKPSKMECTAAGRIPLSKRRLLSKVLKDGRFRTHGEHSGEIMDSFISLLREVKEFVI